MNNDQMDTIRKRIERATRELQSALNEWLAILAEPIRTAADLDRVMVGMKAVDEELPYDPQKGKHKGSRLDNLRQEIIDLLTLAPAPLRVIEVAQQLKATYDMTTKAIRSEMRIIRVDKRVWLRSRKNELSVEQRIKPTTKTKKTPTYPIETEVYETLANQQPLSTNELSKILKYPAGAIWSALQNEEKFERDGELWWLKKDPEKGGSPDDSWSTPILANPSNRSDSFLTQR